MNISAIIQQIFSLPAAEGKKGCWKVAGCSLPGTAHVRRGRTCEDSSDWFASNELLVIAVADGAGSAAQAAVGSALAVRTALRTIKDIHLKICPITDKTATHALEITCQNTLNTLCAKAAESGTEPHDMASTLILVVATRSFVAAAQVGDGAVVVIDDKGNLTALTTPTNGEFANETVLLGCMPTLDVQIGTLTKFHLKSIAVITDGIQRLALRMPKGIPHEPFFNPLFERLQRLPESEMEKVLKEFLDSPRVNTRTDDDKTLVTACAL